jgi:hypothetical protein
MRPWLLLLVLGLAAGCGGESPDERGAGGRPIARANAPQPPAESRLERAARDLVPASFSIAPGPKHVRLCTFGTAATGPCASLHVRTADLSRVARAQAVVRAARAHGWTLTAARSPAAGSTTLFFQRGRLYGRVVLARSGPVAIVIVTTTPLKPSPAPVPVRAKSSFVAAAVSVCRRFDADVDRIPESLPRSEGIARVRARWRTLVTEFERLRPPPDREESYRRFVAELHAFEAALDPFRPEAAAAAAEQVERTARSLGLTGCVSRG